jgi:hypothetical protein
VAVGTATRPERARTGGVFLLAGRACGRASEMPLPWPRLLSELPLPWPHLHRPREMHNGFLCLPRLTFTRCPPPPPHPAAAIQRIFRTVYPGRENATPGTRRRLANFRLPAFKIPGAFLSWTVISHDVRRGPSNQSKPSNPSSLPSPPYTNDNTIQQHPLAVAALAPR